MSSCEQEKPSWKNCLCKCVLINTLRSFQTSSIGFRFFLISNSFKTVFLERSQKTLMKVRSSIFYIIPFRLHLLFNNCEFQVLSDVCTIKNPYNIILCNRNIGTPITSHDLFKQCTIQLTLVQRKGGCFLDHISLKTKGSRFLLLFYKHLFQFKYFLKFKNGYTFSELINGYTIIFPFKSVK